MFRIQEDSCGAEPVISTLTYRSQASSTPTSEDLDTLVAKARVRNHRASVTGMLLYEDGRFLQTLEGPAAGLNQIWSSIRRDERHGDIEVLAEHTAPARLFSEWDLLLYRRSGQAPQTIRDKLGRKDPLTQQVPVAVRLALEADEAGARDLFAKLVAKGWTGDEIAKNLIEPTARALGDAWLADECSEFDLTLGLGVLQRAGHVVRYRSDMRSPQVKMHSILLASAPGEPHALGPSLLANQFADAGWAVDLVFPKSDEALADMIGEQQPDVVDISLSDALPRHSMVASLRESVQLSRGALPDQNLVVSVGGRLFAESAATAEHVGADHARKTSASASIKLGQLAETCRPRPAAPSGAKPSSQAD